MYIIKNDVFASINGKSVKFGVRVCSDKNKISTLTLKEVEKLEREFKIKYSGSQQLSYIQTLEIVDGVVVGEISERYLDQLKYMGYDTSKLEYVLK